MISISTLEGFLDSHPQAPGDLKQRVALPTLVVKWDRAPELFWTLRLTEYCGDASRQWGYQPPAEWYHDGQGTLSYADSPLAPEQNVEGTCSCTATAAGDALSFELSITNHSEQAWPDCWGWLCLIHRWARAFQANGELPAGPPDRPWVSASSLQAPLERWLKWCPVADRRVIATRIGENQGTRWQPHIQAQQGAVRAWRVEGDRQQVLQLSSPEAIILGWSHWPCTDMGVYFGTLEPEQTGHITGRLEFSENAFVPI